MRILMLISMGFTMGICYLTGTFPLSFSLILNLVMLGAVLYWHKTQYLEDVLLWLLCGATFALGYFVTYEHYFYQSLQDYHGQSQEIVAEVRDFPTWGSYSYSVMVDVEFPQMPVKSLLYMDKEASQLKPGDKIIATSSLYTGGETFDGEEISYYTAKGILLRGTVSDVESIEAVDGVTWKHLPAYLANWLKEGIYSVFPSKYASVIQALLTGNKENLTEQFSTALQRSGLSHTVAVSGMHLAFLAGLLRLLLPAGRRISAFLVIVVMILFMLMTGSTPSIMRATVMIVMLQLAPLFGRERDDATALSFSVMLILLQNPFAINHVGLHLSVLSVMGILCFADKIQRFFGKVLRFDWQFAKFSLKKFLSSSISATFSAMFFTTPVVGYYFGSISLIAPISNILCLGAVSYAFGVGLISATVGILFPTLGKLLSLSALPLLEYLLWTVTQLSKLPLASLSLESVYYQVFLVFVYVLLVGWMLFPKKKTVFVPVILIPLAFFSAMAVHRYHYFQQDLSFEVFDVGQGQSILFQVEDTLLLSDCGGSSGNEVGNMVADSIQALGRNNLELVVLSHCHADHCNGMMQLMERVHIQTIAMPPVDMENPLQVEILEKAEACGTEIWIIEEESIEPLGNDSQIRLLPPLGWGDANEEGLTLLISVGEVDVLMTGDMGSEFEEILVETYQLPDVEVFVVGHHGSRFSSSELYLDSITAEIAIISVSGSNTYGHPTNEVLWKLHERDIAVYRTDLQGKIAFQLTG